MLPLCSLKYEVFLRIFCVKKGYFSPPPPAYSALESTYLKKHQKKLHFLRQKWVQYVVGGGYYRGRNKRGGASFQEIHFLTSKYREIARILIKQRGETIYFYQNTNYFSIFDIKRGYLFLISGAPPGLRNMVKITLKRGISGGGRNTLF